MAGEWTAINLGAVCAKIGSGATPRGGGDVYLERGPYALIAVRTCTTMVFTTMVWRTSANNMQESWMASR